LPDRLLRLAGATGASRLPHQPGRGVPRRALVRPAAGRAAGAAVNVTWGHMSLDLAALPSGWIAWPLLFGLGAYLLLMAQPLGRPKPSLAELLRRLDVDECIRDQANHRSTKPVFSSALLERMLRPVLDDAGWTIREWL